VDTSAKTNPSTPAKAAHHTPTPANAAYVKLCEVYTLHLARTRGPGVKNRPDLAGHFPFTKKAKGPAHLQALQCLARLIAVEQSRPRRRFSAHGSNRQTLRRTSANRLTLRTGVGGLAYKCRPHRQQTPAFVGSRDPITCTINRL
jgi:hypothetical protein